MLNKKNRTCEELMVFPVGRTFFTSLVGLLLTGLLTLGAALLLYREILPMTVCNWMGPLIIALSAFCSSWLTARHSPKKLLCGLLSAGIYGLTLMICGMLLFSTPMRHGRMILSTGSLFAGMICGVVLSAWCE